ncbi:MAG: hypothetical protein ACOC14_01075 [Bacillota bacterium]
MKSRKLIIGVLLFLAVAVSSATFAYWANEVNGSNDTAAASVTIGEGESVDTTVTVGDVGADGTLVPAGYEDSSSISNEDKTFTVNWEGDGDGAEGAEGTLNVSIDSLTLGSLSQSQIEDMFTIDVSATPTITEGTPLTYTVNVEFANEPANKTIYDEVENNTLEIDLIFSVATN